MQRCSCRIRDYLRRQSNPVSSADDRESIGAERFGGGGYRNRVIHSHDRTARRLRSVAARLAGERFKDRRAFRKEVACSSQEETSDVGGCRRVDERPTPYIVERIANDVADDE
jgi:hypothetical protein